jgi:hypothetical protein
MPIAPAPHTRSPVSSDDWITPRWLLERLGPFDLDPCAADNPPWRTAAKMITKKQDGLTWKWHGFTWLNPPYGRQLGLWLLNASAHNHGIALTFARTDTKAFQAYVFPFASALLFLRGRLNFCDPSGAPSKKSHNSGGPSVLIAYGPTARGRLGSAADLGAFIPLP